MKLLAYSIKDLKHIEQILTQGEAEKLSLPMIRQRVREAIVSLQQPYVRGGQTKPASPPEQNSKMKRCEYTQGCEGFMEFYERKDLDGSRLLIGKCERCQQSSILAVLEGK